MSPAPSPPAVVAAFIDYLKDLRAKNDPSISDADSLDVALETLAESFKTSSTEGLNGVLSSLMKQENYTLPQVLDAGIKVLHKASEMHNKSGTADTSSQQSSAPPTFSKFLELLTGKGFFKGATTGTTEYEQRVAKAKQTYTSKYGAVPDETANVPPPTTTTSQNPPPAVSDADKKQAETCKTEGNKSLAAGEYQEAIDMYTLAIDLNPNSAIYWANRAAAYIHLKKWDKAIEDATEATKVDSNYGKGYYRLGSAYLNAGSPTEAVPAFERALQLLSNDKSMLGTVQEQLNLAKAKASGSDGGTTKRPAVTSSINPNSRPTVGGSSAASNAAGSGGFDFASMMNNPALANMDMNNMDFASLMQNPAIMQMAAQMMPGMFGGGGAGSAGGVEDMGSDESGNARGMPDMSSLMNNPALQQLQNDPEMRPIIEDVQRNGMGAVSKYM